MSEKAKRHRSKTSASTESQKRQEIFIRMKANQLVSLLLQSIQADKEQCLVRQTLSDLSPDTPAQTSTSTRQPTENIITSGIGERSVTDLGSVRRKVDAVRPYLLLDVRDRDEYDYGHITTALHYAHTMLSRERYETAELSAYKNKAGKVIIVYDESEQDGPRVASTLVQRGYDNCFLLSGGITEAVKKFPNGLISGKIWNSAKPAKVPSNKVNGNAELSEEDVDQLTARLKHNLMPRASKSRAVQNTQSTSNRTQSTESQKRHHKSKQVGGAWR